jgi:hypothetical protein
MNLLEIPDEVFEIGLLDREYHARLLQGLEKWTAIAGIPPRFVWSKLSTYCTAKDVAWVKKLRRDDFRGVVYTGNPENLQIENMMMAITGACLRNYMDARFMTVQSILQQLKDETMDNPTVVLIPNFCDVMASDKKLLTSVHSAVLLGWLYSRLSKNLKTIMYVGSMEAVIHMYGKTMWNHLKSQYVVL